MLNQLYAYQPTMIQNFKILERQEPWMMKKNEMNLILHDFPEPVLLGVTINTMRATFVVGVLHLSSGRLHELF